jgi:hypothetical protein
MFDKTFLPSRGLRAGSKKESDSVLKILPAWR